jgi:hypothetical protein
MKAQSQVVFAVVAVMIGTAAGCFLAGKPTYKSTVVGSRVGGQGLSASGGNLLAHEGRPGVFFGTIKTPDSQERISYFVVFKHDISLPDGFSLSQDGNSSGNSREVSSDHSVVVNGKALIAKHNLKLGEDNQVAEEMLKLGDDIFDLEAGRFFLIDLTTDAPTYEQLDVDIPTDISQLESPADIERIAEEVLEALKPEGPGFFD